MPASNRHSPARARRGTAALSAFALALALLAGAAPADAVTVPGETVVGPLPTLKSLGAIDLAPDGSGAMAYTVEEGGVDHVFVSRLVNGGWSRPERVDGALPGPSSQPVVSSGDGGRVSVAFVNGGNVYAVTRPAALRSWGGIETVWGAGGASNPYVDLSVNRKGYLVFAAPGAGGADVRVAFSRDAAPWTLVGAPLDADPNANAGSDLGRPRVGAAADGVAVVAWGEAGRVIVRRVQGTRPSVVFADATAGTVVEGVGALAADSPEVGVQDDDSFAGIAFRGVFDAGGLRAKVVFRRLRGSRLDGAVAADGAPLSSGQGSGSPRISTGGIGQGLVLGVNDTTHLASALQLRADVAPGPLVQVDSVAQSTAPTYAVPVTATALKMLVAWQLTGADGATDLRARFYSGRDFEPEQSLSRPELGAIDAARGLDAAGDDTGDIAVAFLQQTPSGPSISVAAIDQPPGSFVPRARRAGFERTDRPVLAWTASREAWGASYRIVLDGVELVVTPRTSYQPKTPLSQGTHSWQATVVDRRGQSFTAKSGTVRVDTLAPTGALRFAGPRRTGATLKVAVRTADDPPPPAAGAQPAQTSGVASAVLDWGDRSRRENVRNGSQHAYARPGRYVVSLTVLDKAGNRTVVREPLIVVTPPRPRRRADRDGRGRGRGRGRASASA